MTKSIHQITAKARRHQYSQTNHPGGRYPRIPRSTQAFPQKATEVVQRKLREAIESTIRGNYETARGKTLDITLVPSNHCLQAVFALRTKLKIGEEERVISYRLNTSTQNGESRPYMRNEIFLSNTLQAYVDSLNRNGFNIKFSKSD